jgi:hypothetical protein
MENNSEINENYNPKEAIKKAVSENSLETGIDLSEVLIDNWAKVTGLAEGILVDIPIIKTIYSGLKAYKSITDQIFISKLIKFFAGVEDIDEATRKKIQKSSLDKKAKKELIETTIIAIDRLDEIKKSDALFKIFIAYTTGEINRSEFNIFCHALDKINYDDLTKLRDFYWSRDNEDRPPVISKPEDPSLQRFAFLGLIQLKQMGGIFNLNTESTSMYLTNNQGRSFLKVLGLIAHNEGE